MTSIGFPSSSQPGGIEHLLAPNSWIVFSGISDYTSGYSGSADLMNGSPNLISLPSLFFSVGNTNIPFLPMSLAPVYLMRGGSIYDSPVFKGGRLLRSNPTGLTSSIGLNSLK